MGEEFSEEEKRAMEELKRKLEGGGGVPPLSKALQELQEKKKEKGTE